MNVAINTSPQGKMHKGRAIMKPRDLDTLAEKSFSQLETLYRGGASPATMHTLDGELTGRVLAMRGSWVRSLAAPLLRRLAASEVFPWRGKQFSCDDDHAGSGINRISVPILLGRQRLFNFSTSFGKSLIDGKDTIVLDYDHPENPLYIRQLHDELREVSPGVFVGPVMWKLANRALALGWFALAIENGAPTKH